MAAAGIGTGVTAGGVKARAGAGAGPEAGAGFGVDEHLALVVRRVVEATEGVRAGAGAEAEEGL